MLFVAARLSQIVLWVVKREREQYPITAPDGSTPDNTASDPWIADNLLMSNATGDARAFSDTPRIEALRNESLSLYRRVARLQAQTE